MIPPFITAGVWVTRDPEDGNLGIYRGMIKAPSRDRCANPVNPVGESAAHGQTA